MADDKITDTQKALDEIKAYDLTRIPRRDELGKVLNFEEAVAPARRLQEFFNRIPAEFVPELSTNFVGAVYNQALSFLNILGQIQSFDAQTENPGSARENLLNSLNGLYETVFNSLHPAVSFVASRQRDFSSLELEARAAKEAATRQAADMQKAMKANQEEADRILGEIRKVAAEQGVSQQAAYFKGEADDHDKLAKTWERYTVYVAIGLGLYALATAIFATLYTPHNPYQAVQLGLSKVLIFAVIAYMLFHCARTTLAHRHNAVINHHRENALLTFNPLVAAAGEEEHRDIVLTHAASCIFSPQETGYTKQTGAPGSAIQIVEALPRLAHAVGQGT
jgi:hypothetical protein